MGAFKVKMVTSDVFHPFPIGQFVIISVAFFFLGPPYYRVTQRAGAFEVNLFRSSPKPHYEPSSFSAGSLFVWNMYFCLILDNHLSEKQPLLLW